MMNEAMGTTRNLPKRTHLASDSGRSSACNGRSTERFYLTLDHAAITCARCQKLVAKFPAMSVVVPDHVVPQLAQAPVEALPVVHFALNALNVACGRRSAMAGGSVHRHAPAATRRRSEVTCKPCGAWLARMAPKVAPAPALAARPDADCPGCGAREAVEKDNPDAPFCTRRCSDLDTAHETAMAADWLRSRALEATC